MTDTDTKAQELFKRFEITACLLFRDPNGSLREVNSAIDSVMHPTRAKFTLETFFDLSDVQYVQNYTLNGEQNLKIDVNVPLSTIHGIVYNIASVCIGHLSLGEHFTRMQNEGLSVLYPVFQCFTSRYGKSERVSIRLELIRSGGFGGFMYIGSVRCQIDDQYAGEVIESLDRRRAQEWL